MNDATLAAIVGGLAGSASSVLVTLFQNSWVEARKRRADQYNKQIDEIVALLIKVNDLSLKYWSSSVYLPYEGAAILSSRTELYSLISAAHREQLQIFSEQVFINHINAFYSSITGSGFGSPVRHAADATVLTNARAHFANCRAYAASCRYRWSVLHIVPFLGIK
ncbi:hypothetical protein [Asticcacaulis biprosthecium]|uniref:hypothetical protein n=1 Tax=Asticcacaulis biprosthecium TaxID=76891 RepID=UPI0012F49907|nr:hypothetical protein [Asticcacaulis biprosthecium]